MIQGRLSFIVRCYFQDLIYICHTQQGRFDHTQVDRQQANFPENSPRKHTIEKIKPLKTNHKIGSHIWPLLNPIQTPGGGEGGHRWSGRGGGLASLKSNPFSN